MPSLAEAGQTAQTDFAAAAQTGVDTLSLNQEIVFDLYDRVVLPLDGYVFWLKRLPTDAATTQLTVKGSLHFSSINTQDEAANITVNRMVFTAQDEVNDLNDVSPGTMWIASHPDGFKYAFSSRGSFYEQAGLWHYVGFALYADMQTQIVDDPAGFPLYDDAGTQQIGQIGGLPTELIVSNSLPIWLFLSNYVPQVPTYGFANAFTLYPSFLVPDDLDPSILYGAVDISEESTDAIQAAPIIDSTQSHYQLVQDRVKITLYGGTNKQALDFVDCVNQYSLDYGTIGIMNMPVIRDAKRTQAEFSVIAMKKTVTFDICYYQSNVEDVARQLIQKAQATYNFDEGIVGLDFSLTGNPQDTMLKPGLF